MQRMLLILGIIAASHGAGHADEQAAQVRLLYHQDSSAAACPNEDTVRRGVAARLGRDPFEPHARRVVVVRLNASSREYKASIMVHDETGAVVGQRSLQSKQGDCAELAASMQLSIAIAIDPLHNMPKPLQEQPAQAAVQAQPSHAVQQGPWPPPPPPPPLQEKPASGRFLGGGLFMSTSREPKSTLGFTAHLQDRGSLIVWGLEARYDMPDSTIAQMGQVETSRLAASGLLCVQGPIVDACAMASAGRLHAQGSQYQLSSSASTPYLAAGARLSRHLPVASDFALQVGIDILARLTQTTLLVDNDEVWQSAPYEIALGVRGLWELP